MALEAQTAETQVTEDGVDPFLVFEEFNRAMGAGIVRNPYPDFATLRTQFRTQQAAIEADMMGVSDSGIGASAIVTFEAVQAVLRDGDTFSSKGYEPLMGAVMGHSILEMDEPEHHGHRSLLQQAFTRKEMDRWSVELVEPIVHRLIDAFADRGRAELVRELTFPFPVQVIAALLGLPDQDLNRFHRWAVELISVGFDRERGLRASQQLHDYFATLLGERRANPGNDMISTLAQAELDGERLDDEAIFAFLRLLLPAGAETTYRSSGNLIYGLLSHPEQLDAVRGDRSLMPQAIEEGLRWEPPLLGIMRTATRDTTVEGVPIAAGSVLMVNMGSANHDETRWERPDEFDIFREPKQHLSFAFGPHMCLGMHLARMETSVALNALLDRLPDLRLDPDGDDPHITGMTFRSPTSLPVLFG